MRPRNPTTPSRHRNLSRPRRAFTLVELLVVIGIIALLISIHSKRAPQHRSAPDPRHGGKANVAFCDGHVEAMTLPQLGYVLNPDGSVPAEDPRSHNRLFSGRGTDDDPPAIN